MKNSHHLYRILIFSTAYFPFVGGAEIAVKDITEKIKDLTEKEKEDYKFDLITSRFSRKVSQEEKIGNVSVFRVGLGMKIDKYFLPFWGFLKALSLSQRYKYSGIWAIMASYNAFAALFFKWLRPNIPFLLTLQEGDSIEHIEKKDPLL